MQNDHVLLTTLKDSVRWSVPGGRVEKGETAQSAIVREFEEECGVTISVIRPLLTLENSFEKHGDLIQEINIYFLVQVPSWNVEAKEEKNVFKWFKIESLTEINLLPEVAKAIISKTHRGEALEPYLSTS